MGSYEINPDFLKNDKHDLQCLNKRLGGCKSVCDYCDCADNLRPLLARHELRVTEVLRMDSLPRELVDDFKEMKKSRTSVPDEEL